jgi:hypothetical protein
MMNCKGNITPMSALENYPKQMVLCSMLMKQLNTETQLEGFNILLLQD